MCVVNLVAGWLLRISTFPMFPERSSPSPIPPWLHLTKCVTWLIHVCDVTNSYVWRDEFMYDEANSYMWHDSFVCVTWLIWYVWQDSFISVTMVFTFTYHPFDCMWHMCDVTYSCVWRDEFVCVAWLINMCNVANLDMWHDSFIWGNDSFIRVTWIIHMCVCDMFLSCVWRDSFVCETWLIHMCDMTVCRVREERERRW